MGLMASFERGMERFLVPVAIKLNSQKHVAAVRDGFVFTFPIIMASSLIILINFAILSPDGFIAGLLHLNSIFPNLEKAQAIFTPVMNGSVNIMSIMIAFLVARNMAIREGANKQVISSQADSLIKISRIWADFFPANTSNQPI